MSRSAIMQIFGYVQKAYFYYFGEDLKINFETPSFNAIHKRITLPQGWNGSIGADPTLLLEREYDKIIYVSRELIDLSKALAKYHRNASTIDDIIKLAIDEPHFFTNIKKKRDKLEKYINDPRFFKFTLKDWNCFTFQTFNELLDFLEFPKEHRPLIIPVKFTKKQRNFEGYSCSHLPKDYIISEKIEVIRNE